MNAHKRQHSPAAERDHGLILDVLPGWRWQPSDPDPRALGSALATALYLLSGCASMSSQEAMPNMYQRAKVLSQDDAAISIEHNESGKQIASRTAARHCASVKRTAVYRDSITRLGSDVTSTWQCE